MNIPENSNTKRISIDLPEELISRFDQLRKEWGFRARGPVIEKILKELLQEDDLLPKNQQQEIEFNEKNNNEKLNIDEDTALVLIKSDVKNEDNEISLNKRVSNNNQYNEKANSSLKKFYERSDTLSLGVCNGCQLFIELGLLHPEHEIKPKMEFNESNKFECIFTSVKIASNNSIMFKDFEDTELGIWSAHGEGRFSLPQKEKDYNIIGKYSSSEFPTNPNGSDYDTAIIASKDGIMRGIKIEYLIDITILKSGERLIFVSKKWAYLYGQMGLVGSIC